MIKLQILIIFFISCYNYNMSYLYHQNYSESDQFIPCHIIFIFMLIDYLIGL